MALPTKQDLFKLGHSIDGTPWVKIVTKSTINPNGLQLSIDGSPWWGHGGEGGEPPAPTDFKIWLGDVQIQKMYLGSVEITKAYLESNQL